MWPVNESSVLTFRPLLTWRQSLVFSAVAFGLTVAGIYYFSQKAGQRSNAVNGSRAVAILECKPVGDRAMLPSGDIFSSPANSKNIKTRILSPSFIRQALYDALATGYPAGASPITEKGNKFWMADKNGAQAASSVCAEQLLQGLNVRIEPREASGEDLITLDLTLSQCPDADRLVRALAERFLREYRAFWAAEAQKACQDASSQVDQAEETHRKAVEAVQAFNDNVLAQEKSSPGQHPVKPGDRQLATQIAENPAWIELNHKLALLREREKGMLEIKTPLHPDVEEVRERIADLQQQLDSTPRFVLEAEIYNPVRQMESADNPIRPMDSPTTNNAPALVNVETLKQLQLAAERAEQDYQEKLANKKKLFEIANKEPYCSISVNRVAVASPQPGSDRGFMGFLLCSGFAMALGTGVFSSGLTAQPVLATIADLEPLLPVPIIGVTPDKGRSCDPVARRRRRMILRWVLIASGGLMILGCSISVYCFFS